ncbi:MAG: hypothetical protein U5R14_03395 [Gemmatimonadota bacterium]|nr:hypothetical protein [Gemmatimonadota bacterium]
MKDEQLREAYARIVEERAPTDRASCPAPEALVALVERDGPEAERLRTLDHVMACASCRPELELLRTAEKAASPTSGPAVPRYAMAAGIALALIGGTLWFLVSPGAAPVYRDGASDASELVEPLGAVASPPSRLLWRSVEDAVRYEVELLESDGTLLFRSTTTDTVLDVASGHEWAESAEYRWRVEAVLLGGATESVGVGTFSVGEP